MEIVEGTVEISELQVTKEDDLPIVQLLPLWFQEDPSRLQLRPETSIGKDIREESWTNAEMHKVLTTESPWSESIKMTRKTIGK